MEYALKAFANILGFHPFVRKSAESFPAQVVLDSPPVYLRVEYFLDLKLIPGGIQFNWRWFGRRTAVNSAGGCRFEQVNVENVVDLEVRR